MNGVDPNAAAVATDVWEGGLARQATSQGRARCGNAAETQRRAEWLGARPLLKHPPAQRLLCRTARAGKA